MIDSPETLDAKAWDRWYTWTPRLASRAAHVDVVTAVQDFVSIDTEVGLRAERWLKTEALGAYPSVVTRVLLRDDRIEAFYGLASSTVLLSMRHRSRLIERVESLSLQPTQPASLIAPFARHRDASAYVTEELFTHAVSVALRVQELEGNVALVVEPWSEEQSKMLQERFGFRRSVTEARSRVRRLWIPLLPSSTLSGHA